MTFGHSALRKIDGFLVQDDPSCSPRTQAIRKGTCVKDDAQFQQSITKNKETINSETPLKVEKSTESPRPKSASFKKT